jgi:uncharacterized membrane protein
VAGSIIATTQRAFAWRNGQLATLPGLRGGAGAQARRIGDTGVIAGSAFDAAGAEHAVLWVLGHIVDLGNPPGYLGSYATDLTPSGEVVGGAFDDLHNVAFRRRLGRFQILPTLGGADAQASGAGLRGDVAGFSVTADGRLEATVWDPAGTSTGAAPTRR